MPPRSKFINVDFEPKLHQVEQDFVRLGRSFENKRPVLAAAAVVARRDIENMFEDESDAFGDKWEYWKTWPAEGHSKSYADIAEELPNVGILNRESAPDGLRSRATSSSEFAIKGNYLTYGATLPEFAVVHLTGDYWVSDDYQIPQRSFYPYSQWGVTEVQRLFDAWAAHNIEIMPRTSSRGKQYIQIQTRTPGGQFGPSPL